MNLQITIKQGAKAVKTVRAAVGQAAPVALTGELAPSGSPFPAGHALIVAKGKDLFVQLAEGMDALLTRGGTTVKLAELRAKGHAKKTGSLELIPLPEGAGVEVTLGGWTLSVQPAPVAKAAPAPVARVPQPGATAGGSAAIRDVWAPYRIFSDTARLSAFMRVVIGSLLISLTIMYIFSSWVVIRDPFEVSEIPERYAKFIAPPIEEEIEAPAAAGKAPEQAAQKVEEAPAGGGEEEQKAGGEAKEIGEAERREKMAEKVKSTGLLAIIGSKGSGGALRDVLSEGTLGGDLDRALESMKGSGLGVAKTGEDLKTGGTRGGTGYGTADIGALDTGGPGKGVGLGSKAATNVKSDIASGEITAVGSLDSAAIASVVKAKISGIKYCYEKELKNNPKLAGKVVVNFTIGATGEVSAYKIESSTIGNADVEQCILRMVRRWKFPAPQGGDVNVSYPFIFTAQG